MSMLGLQELRVQVKELEASERVRQRLGWEPHSGGFVLFERGVMGRLSAALIITLNRSF